MTRRVQVALVPLRAVLWDIDGTLADSKPVHERFFAKA
ncbi:hypothetical protein EV662_109146 [Rhodovulum marinum]|uniref:Haloacid dehalogenase-like hydrolase n=1 Tax=Rhodovulum marinum TaxID=320662 RepID=A0A4R2PVI7_9RHOB|nr:hypothetical protein EV662_109146 [Rhodovulum marinum]